MILDLRTDDSLFEAGVAREVFSKVILNAINCRYSPAFTCILIGYCCVGRFLMNVFGAELCLQVVNRIQKLRKKAALEPTDMVEVFFKSLDNDEKVSKQILESQVHFVHSIS